MGYHLLRFLQNHSLTVWSFLCHWICLETCSSTCLQSGQYSPFYRLSSLTGFSTGWPSIICTRISIFQLITSQNQSDNSSYRLCQTRLGSLPKACTSQSRRCHLRKDRIPIFCYSFLKVSQEKDTFRMYRCHQVKSKDHSASFFDLRGRCCWDLHFGEGGLSASTAKSPLLGLTCLSWVIILWIMVGGLLFVWEWLPLKLNRSECRREDSIWWFWSSKSCLDQRYNALMVWDTGFCWLIFYWWALKTLRFALNRWSWSLWGCTFCLWAFHAEAGNVCFAYKWDVDWWWIASGGAPGCCLASPRTTKTKNIVGPSFNWKLPFICIIDSNNMAFKLGLRINKEIK